MDEYIRWKVKGELYNGGIRLLISKPTDQSQHANSKETRHYVSPDAIRSKKHQLQVFMWGNTVEFVCNRAYRTSFQFTDNRGDRKVKLTSWGRKTIHTVGYRRNKLVSSTGQCHE